MIKVHKHFKQTQRYIDELSFVGEMKKSQTKSHFICHYLFDLEFYLCFFVVVVVVFAGFMDTETRSSYPNRWNSNIYK